MTAIPQTYFYRVAVDGANICGRNEYGYIDCWGDEAGGLQSTTRGGIEVALAERRGIHRVEELAHLADGKIEPRLGGAGILRHVDGPPCCRRRPRAA